MKNLKSTILLLFVLSIPFSESSAQGELLNIDQSGGAFLFETSSTENRRAYAIGYSYVHKRKFETGISVFRSGGRKYSYQKKSEGVGLYFAGFLNSDSWIHMKGSVGFSFAGNNPATILSSTLFVENSKKPSKLIPSISLLLVSGDVAYSGGLQFRLGGSLNFIGGLHATKFKKSDTAISLSIGVLFAQYRD